MRHPFYFRERIERFIALLIVVFTLFVVWHVFL
jgi:hypothetical protein